MKQLYKISGHENYMARVIKVNEYTKHPNADKLWLVNIDFQNVITGVEPTIGDLYVYFPVLSKINTDFISSINGFRDKDLNKNKEIVGFFENNARVKPIKLRGIASEGYLHPVKDIESFLDTTMEEGMEFNKVDDIVFCEKYIILDKKVGMSGGKQAKKSQIDLIIDGQFAFHADTENLRRNISKIQPDDIIGIHYKKHGTSLVVSKPLIKTPLTKVQKFLKWIGFNIVDKNYGTVISSRRVIKSVDGNDKESNHFYGADIWSIAGREIEDKIPNGYTLYCEIVGYTPENFPIQDRYDYGCNVGNHSIWVYRITQTNDQGFTIELTDKQIGDFCNRFGFNYSKTLIYYGTAGQLYPDIAINGDWHKNLLNRLEQDYLERDCHLCINKVPAEGIVLRKENLFLYEAYKLKSFSFLQLEGAETKANIEDLII